MKDLISLDQMFDNIKLKNEESKLSIEASEKAIAIVDKIVKARKNLGLTQRELAKKCGIKQPALARIETYRVIPQINTLIKIAKVVGVDIEAFSTTESEQMKICFSISCAVVNSTYNNNIGGYLWKQNSIALR